MILTLIGLGACPDEISNQAMQALCDATCLVLRTKQYMGLEQLPIKATMDLDDCYDLAEDFEALKGMISDRMLKLLIEGNVTYATPGSVSCDLAAAELIRKAKQQGHTICVFEGQGFASSSLAQAMTLLDCDFTGYVAISARDLTKADLDVTLPLIVTEMDNLLQCGQAKIMLGEYWPDTQKVVWVYFADGKWNSQLIDLCEIDRMEKVDHTCCVVLPPVDLAQLSRMGMRQLVLLLQTLRGKDGCPWDKKQTHQSLRRYLIEETYEAAQAIDEMDMDMLCDELGDVLLQVVFHAQVASEHGEFAIRDVTTAVCQKMITRHPHIFGDVLAETPEQVKLNWDAIKKKEKQQKDLTETMMDIPAGMPSLMRAQKVQDKASQAGLDFADVKDAILKIAEEAQEILSAKQQDRAMEVGDLLFSVVNVCRLLGLDSEHVLLLATQKFISRFDKLEAIARQRNLPLPGASASKLDEIWCQIKENEAKM